MAFSGYLDLAPFRQEVHYRDTNAVKATRSLVGTFFKLSPKLEDRHNTFERRDLPVHLVRKLQMNVSWNPAAVILYGDTTIDVDRHRHPLGIARHALVD